MPVELFPATEVTAVQIEMRFVVCPMREAAVHERSKKRRALQKTRVRFRKRDAHEKPLQ